MAKAFGLCSPRRQQQTITSVILQSEVKHACAQCMARTAGTPRSNGQVRENPTLADLPGHALEWLEQYLPGRPAN